MSAPCILFNLSLIQHDSDRNEFSLGRIEFLLGEIELHLG